MEPLGFGYRLVAASQWCHSTFYQNAMEMRRRAKLIARYPAWLTNLSKRMVGVPPKSAATALDFVPEQQRLDALYSILYSGELQGSISLPISLDMHVRPPLRIKGETPWLWELFEKSS